MVTGLILLLAAAAIIGIITMVVLQKKGTSSLTEGGNDMTMKNLYHYLVLFATLMMSIGGSVGVFMSAADYVSPRPYYESFEQYRVTRTETKAPNEAVPSETELRKTYDEMIAAEKQRIKEGAVNGMIKAIGWILIPLPIFFYFQRQVRKK